MVVLVAMCCFAVPVPHKRDRDQDGADQERQHLPAPKPTRRRFILVYRQCFGDKLRERDEDERPAADEQDEGGLSGGHFTLQSEDKDDSQNRRQGRKEVEQVGLRLTRMTHMRVGNTRGGGELITSQEGARGCDGAGVYPGNLLQGLE